MITESFAGIGGVLVVKERLITDGHIAGTVVVCKRALANGHVLLGNLITRQHKASILLALLALPYVSHAARAADFLPVRYPVCGE